MRPLILIGRMLMISPISRQGILALASTALIFIGPCQAQAVDTTISSEKELVIGTKEAPPFSMKTTDGNWIGISIDLWRRIADELHLRYRFADSD